MKALRDHGDKSPLPGFYKYFVKDGKFKYHSEKGVDVSMAVRSIEAAYETPSMHQIFCIADTDFLPVFKKLDDMGTNYFIAHVGSYFPKEFSSYKNQGKLVCLSSGDLSDSAIESIIANFMYEDGYLYKGENRDVYEFVATSRWRELEEYQSWQDEKDLNENAKKK